MSNNDKVTSQALQKSREGTPEEVRLQATAENWQRWCGRDMAWEIVPGTSRGDRVTPIGVKFCTMLHIGPGTIFSAFGDGAPKGSQKSQILGLKFGHLTANISKTVAAFL